MARLVAVTAALEGILADVVGTQPELVILKDYRGMALRMSRLLEANGLEVKQIPGWKGNGAFDVTT